MNLNLLSWNPISWMISAGSWLADLSADVFWGLVTSYPVISIMGMAAAASFVVSHTPALVERFIPVIVPYTRGAAIVCLVSSAWLMFAFGYRVADGREEIERLKNNLEFSEFMLGEQSAAAEAAHQLKAQAESDAAEARGKLDAYHEKFGANPGVSCPEPPGYREWLRTLQRRGRHAVAAAGADEPQRDLVARMRAIGAKRR